MTRRRELVAGALASGVAISVACGNELAEDATTPSVDGGDEAAAEAAPVDGGPALAKLAWVKQLDFASGDASLAGAGGINGLWPVPSGVHLSGFVSGKTSAANGSAISGAFRAFATSSDGAITSTESHPPLGAYAFGQAISGHSVSPDPFWAVQFEGAFDIGDASFGDGGDDGGPDDYGGLALFRPGGSLRYRHYLGGAVQISHLVARPGGEGVVVAGTSRRPASMRDEQSTVLDVTSANENTIFVTRVMGSGEDLVATSTTNGVRHADEAISSDTVSTVFLGGAFSDHPPFDPNGPTAQGTDGFLTALDDDLKPKWGLAFGGSGDQTVSALAGYSDSAAESTGVFVAGTLNGECSAPGLPTITSHGNSDVFIARVGSDGRVAWLRGIGAGGNEIAQSMAFDPVRKHLYVSFYTDSADLDLVSGMPSPDGTYAILAQLDQDGNVIGVLARGAPNGRYDRLPVAVESGGTVYFAGSLAGSMILGAQTITAAPRSLFYARFDP